MRGRGRGRIWEVNERKGGTWMVGKKRKEKKKCGTWMVGKKGKKEKKRGEREQREKGEKNLENKVFWEL